MGVENTCRLVQAVSIALGCDFATTHRSGTILVSWSLFCSYRLVNCLRSIYGFQQSTLQRVVRLLMPSGQVPGMTREAGQISYPFSYNSFPLIPTTYAHVTCRNRRYISTNHGLLTTPQTENRMGESCRRPALRGAAAPVPRARVCCGRELQQRSG